MNAIVKIDNLHNHNYLKAFVNAMVDNELRHYASDLFPELEMKNESLFNKSILRAQTVCTTLNLPLHRHFKKIYRTSGKHTYCDYKLSNTAYLLVSINGDVESKKVAQIQMQLIKKLLA